MSWVFVTIVFAVLLGHDDWQSLVGPENAPEEIAPIEAPFAMPQFSRPKFPDRTFCVTDFGARGDGATLNTEFIQAAVNACSDAGGGVVEIPEGTWLTGAIHLKSHVNLHLAKGAVVRFSDNPQDYLPVVFTRWAGFECYNYSPLIYAKDGENIAITGEGCFDGNGRNWWSWFERQEQTAMRMYREQILQDIPPEERRFGTPEDGLRPQFIAPINCRNVLLEGFRIAAPGPFWTIDITYCEGVIIRRLFLYTVGGPNTDGINIDSSRDVLIEHCFLETGDDCICMKSGMNEDGWRVGRPTENVVIRYNRTGKGHGGAVFGSDTSGGIRNIYVHHCVFAGTDMGVRLKSTRGRGGYVERIWVENISMQDVTHQAIQISAAYRAWMGTTEGKAPRFADITLRDVHCDSAQTAVEISGLPEAPVENLRLERVYIRAGDGMKAEHVKSMALCDVNIETVHEKP